MGLVAGTNVISTKVDLETYVTGTDALTFDAPLMGKQSIADGATVAAIANMDFDKDKLEYLYLLSDQDITLTFTLSTGTKTIALLAGVPWYWSRSYVASIPNPFAYSSVSCTAANASGSAATLTVRGGVNA